MEERFLEEFKKTGKYLSEQKFDLSICELYLNTDEGVFGAYNIKDLSKIKKTDLKKVNGQIPAGKNAMIFSLTPFCKEMIKMGSPFRAPLDDTCQIIGPAFGVIKGSGKDPFNNQEFDMNLKSANALYVLEGQNDDNSYLGYTITTGRDLMEAATALIVLEKGAKVTILSTILTGVKPVGVIPGLIQRKFYEKKYSKNTISGFSHNEKKDFSKEELKLRKEIVAMGLKLLETGLVERTWGNISCRLDDTHMLVTPSGIEYTKLLPEDIVKVNINTLDFDGYLKPTSEKRLHSLIYQKREDVKAVIHTHADFLSTYAASHEGIDDIPCSNYGMSGTKALAKNTLSALGSSTSVIIANHGMISVGTSLDEAFNRCLTLEEKAKNNLDIKLG